MQPGLGRKAERQCCKVTANGHVGLLVLCTALMHAIVLSLLIAKNIVHSMKGENMIGTAYVLKKSESGGWSCTCLNTQNHRMYGASQQHCPCVTCNHCNRHGCSSQLRNKISHMHAVRQKKFKWLLTLPHWKFSLPVWSCRRIFTEIKCILNS